MNSRYGDTDWDEDSEFTRLADAIAGKRAPPIADGARKSQPPHRMKIHLRPGAQRATPIKAAARSRMIGGLIALGLLAAATGALVTHQLLDQPASPEVEEEPAGPIDYSLKPTPAVDALGMALPIWVRVSKPAVTVTAAAPSLKGLDIAYETWQHGLGGQRDVTTFGRFAGGPYVFVAFYRQGKEAQAAPTFFVDSARQAAEAGLGVIRTDVPIARPTKFGSTDMAHGVLTNGPLRRECLVFRNRSFNNGLTLSGWACGGGDRAIDADTLACMIDGTGFAATGDDAFGGLLTAADRNRRPACATPAPAAGATKPPPRRS